MRNFSAVFSPMNFCLLLLLVLLSWFFFHSQVNDKQYITRIRMICTIQQQTERLVRNILLVENEYYQHYDHVAAAEKELLSLSTQLRPNNSSEQLLRDDLQQLIISAEHIKFLHAGFKNSLLYFPKSTEQLYRLLITDKAQPLLTETLIHWERSVMLFNIFKTPASGADLRAQMNVMKNLLNSIPEKYTEPFAILSQHTHIMLHYHQQIAFANEKLLDNKIALHSQALISEYSQLIQGQRVQKHRVLMAFYGVCMVLLVWIFFCACRIGKPLTVAKVKQ